MPARTVRTTLAIVLVVLLTTAGCGGGDGDDETSASGDDATTTTTEAAAGDESGEEAKVKKIVLKLADFPAGWKSSPAREDTEDEEAAEEAFEQCIGVDLSDDIPEAESPDFATGEGAQASATASLLPSVEVAEQEFAAVQGSKLDECAVAQIDRELKAQGGGAQFAPPKAERVDFPTVGDASFAIRLTTSVTAQGQEVPIYADLVAIKKGRVAITMNLLNVGTPFNAALAAELARRLVSRA